MLRRLIGSQPSALTGMTLSAAGYSLFATQDALVKWLVADYSVPQILFMRSLVITVFAAFVVRRERAPSILKSPNRHSLVLRAALMLGAWLSFYSATRHLALAQITTLYFSAPLIVVFLSIVILRESVGPARWIASLAGLAGVVVAANPKVAPDLLPAAMAVFAAFCWAWSVILVRLVSRTETTSNQMMATGLLFAVVCGAMLPWLWIWPTATGWALMIILGLIGCAGQFLVYEGFRYAPASAVAPMEYTGLIWAMFYGFVFWREVPTSNVFGGAFLIVGSSLSLIWWERRNAAASAKLT